MSGEALMNSATFEVLMKMHTVAMLPTLYLFMQITILFNLSLLLIIKDFITELILFFICLLSTKIL